MSYSKHAEDKLETPVDASKERENPEVDGRRVPDPEDIRKQKRHEKESEDLAESEEDAEARESSQFNTD